MDRRDAVDQELERKKEEAGQMETLWASEKKYLKNIKELKEVRPRPILVRKAAQL